MTVCVFYSGWWCPVPLRQPDRESHAVPHQYRVWLYLGPFHGSGEDAPSHQFHRHLIQIYSSQTCALCGARQHTTGNGVCVPVCVSEKRAKEKEREL